MPLSRRVILFISADDQVTPAGAAQDCIGIAMEIVADTEPVGVLVRGRVKVAAGGAITRGKQSMALILPIGS